MERQLLVLCIGNICRSPMAEALLARALPAWKVHSAGLGAMVGDGAAPETLSVLGEIGDDLAQHQARQVDEAMMRQSELVLVMTLSQKEETERRFPWARGRVFRIGHWDGFDVDDPYKRPLEAFQQTRALIETAVGSWQKRLA